MSLNERPATASSTPVLRSRGYLVYLIIFMGLVAVMDQYLSTIKSTAIPYILDEYNLSASQFSYLEAAYLAFTFLIFLLNGLTDIIGRTFWDIYVDGRGLISCLSCISTDRILIGFPSVPDPDIDLLVMISGKLGTEKRISFTILFGISLSECYLPNKAAKH